MEYLFWIAFLVMILASSLRFKVYTTTQKRHLLSAYFLSLLATILFRTAMRDTAISNTERILAGIEFSDNDWSVLSPLIGLYTNSNPIIFLAGLILCLELITFIFAAAYKRSIKKTDNHSALTGSMSRWWANVILLIGAPALLYGLLSYSDASERSPTHFSFIFFPVVAAYGAPACQLILWQPTLFNTANTKCPSKGQINLNRFSNELAPWFLMCILLTLASCIKAQSTPQLNPITLQKHFLGNKSWGKYLHIANLTQLPWRGKCLLVVFLLSVVLALVPILLEELFYGVFAFLYNLFWIGPLTLITLIYLIFKKSSKK